MFIKPKTSLAESVARGVCDLFPSLFEAVETNGDPGLPAAEKPKRTPWELLIESVKNSGMSEAMQTASVAQAIVESARGTSRVASECSNFWGMKMRPELDGLAVGREVPVTSETSGKAVFAAFKTTSDAVKGWQKFLSRPYYAGWEQYREDAPAFIRHIGKSWCPAAGYAEKVIKCIPEARELLGVKPPAAKNGKLIVLNPGHAGTTGASGKNPRIAEHVENEAQAIEVGRILTARGFSVRIVRQSEFGGDLYRTGRAAAGALAFISLHQNAADGAEHGAEVLVGGLATSESKKLAAAISTRISATLCIRDRGVKSKTVSVIKGACEVCPVVCLVESQFIDDEIDPIACRKKTMDAAQEIAEAIALQFA